MNSDRIYFNKITGVDINEKFASNHELIKKPIKPSKFVLNPNLVKCTECKKEINLDVRSIRYQNYWYHEECYITIYEKIPKQKSTTLEKNQKTSIEKISQKDELRHRRVKQDPVLYLLAATILAFLFSAAYLLIGSFSFIAMILAGILITYQLIDSKKWGTKKYRTSRKAPAIFPLFVLFLPFVLAGILTYEGYTAWESVYRAIILWGLTLVFWNTLLMIPLSIYSKNKEEGIQTTPYTPLVSIIIPAYNEEKVIANTIESAIEINYSNKDIIVVDDGSTDSTLEIIKKYEKQGVKILHKENGGKASALNLALNFTKGEIVAILDADTLASRNSISEIVKVFQSEKNIAAVAGNIKVKNKNNWITWCQALEYVAGIQITRRAFDMFGAITIVPGALGSFRKSVLLEAGSYDKETIVEDFDTTIKILKSGVIVRGTTKSVAYTEAPNTLKDFCNQRKRWYRGNLQVVTKHRNALTNQRFGFLQKLAFPYMIIAMVILPITGFFVLGSAIMAIIQGDGLFVLTSFGFFIALQYLISAMAVRIDGDDPKMILYSVFFNLGYKQLLDALLLHASIVHLFKRKAKWTSAKRIGNNKG